MCSSDLAEGQAFWVIRTAPISLRDFLWSKFWTGLVPVLVLTEVLTMSANQLLGVDPFLKLVSAVAIALLSVALVGVATGLGARYPRFTADNPSASLHKISEVYDNIAFGVRLFESLPRVEMDERVEWALRKAALWTEVKDKLGQSGSGLSGGQQQRLCIARGIAIKPEVLLLDEPCSALDPISTGKIEELIHELKADYTVVIVTHNMQQAARCSDYTAYMYLGDLVEFGPTAELFMKPKKKDTEDYITGRFG